jgi:non-heme Fe2+,alpha-ketoglutarate-dependent halogenase
MALIELHQSMPEMGCVRSLPGPHRLAQIPHRDTFAKNNLLSRGQTIQLGLDEAAAVFLRLKAGKMSLHHVLTIHASQPHRFDTYRIGFIVNYISPRVRPKSGSDSAMRGAARTVFYPFDPDPRPPRTATRRYLGTRESNEAAIRQHSWLTGCWRLEQEPGRRMNYETHTP